MPAKPSTDRFDRLTRTPAGEDDDELSRLVDLDRDRFARNLAKLEEARRRALEQTREGSDDQESAVRSDGRPGDASG